MAVVALRARHEAATHRAGPPSRRARGHVLRVAVRGRGSPGHGRLRRRDGPVRLHRAGQKPEAALAERFFDSLGMLYTAVTTHLGFKVFEEGTVMALAGAGGPTYVDKFRELIHLRPDGRFRVNRDFIGYDTHGLNQPFKQRFTEVFGPPRRHGEPITRSPSRSCLRAAGDHRGNRPSRGPRPVETAPIAQSVSGRRCRAQLRRQCAHPARYRLRVRLGAAVRVGFRRPARQRVVALPSDARPCAPVRADPCLLRTRLQRCRDRPGSRCRRPALQAAERP